MNPVPPSRPALPDARLLDRATPPHILTLILATAYGSLPLNLFLPSLPGIASEFGADYSLAQLAISLFLAANACFQPLIGPLSDRYGRRPVLLAFFAVSIVATVACVFATNIWTLLVLRVLQATSAAGFVIARATVRDTVDMDAAASRIGYITMAMALVPMTGPAIGGWLDATVGWRAVFWLTAAFGAVALMLALADMGETNANRGQPFARQFAAWPRLLRSPLFWGYSATATFTSGAFFSFLGGGPFLATAHYGLTPSQYGIYFAFTPVGYIFGNFLAGRFSRRFGVGRMMVAGAVLMSAGMLASLGVYYLGIDSPLVFFAFMSLVGMGNGIGLPNSMAGVVSVNPALAGAASGLGGFLQQGGAALLSIAAGFLVVRYAGPAPLIALMASCGLASVATSLYIRRVTRDGATQSAR